MYTISQLHRDYIRKRILDKISTFSIVNELLWVAMERNGDTKRFATRRGFRALNKCRELLSWSTEGYEGIVVNKIDWKEIILFLNQFLNI